MKFHKCFWPFLNLWKLCTILILFLETIVSQGSGDNQSILVTSPDYYAYPDRENYYGDRDQYGNFYDYNQGNLIELRTDPVNPLLEGETPQFKYIPDDDPSPSAVYNNLSIAYQPVASTFNTAVNFDQFVSNGVNNVPPAWGKSDIYQESGDQMSMPVEYGTFDHPLSNSHHRVDIFDSLESLFHGELGEKFKEVIVVAVLFLGFYILFVLAFTKTNIFQPKCKNWGWDIPEWEVHAEARFVPFVPMDPHLQAEFLHLFRIIGEIRDKKKYEGSSSSSEEYDQFMDPYASQLDHINHMCPREAFFYGFAPRHIEAIVTLQRMFVAQPSPAEILHLARAVLLSGTINPKVWYWALIATAVERPDMSGFSIPHPLDALPDLFIPAHLLDKKFHEEWRSGLSSAKSLLGRNFTTSAKKSRPKRENDSDKQSKLNPFPKKNWIDDGLHYNKGDNFDFVPSNDLKFHRGKHKKHKHKKKKKGKKKGKKEKKKKCIHLDRIGEAYGKENMLWYWREDMMLNQHHLYWHQVYPPNATRHGDRRAELFFFMHRSFLARYNAERLSNGLHRTQLLELEHGAPIVEGYHSYLADVNSGQYWTPRGPHTPLVDAIHENDPDFARNIYIEQLQLLVHRFHKAIHTGKLVALKGGYVRINSKYGYGADPLGNTVEASNISVNPMYYDGFGLHNLGHIIISLASDPVYLRRLPPGLMADAAVSMRDPVFYTYHSILDELYEKYKASLPPYSLKWGAYPLLWYGVEVLDVEIVTKQGENHEIKTFYRKQIFPLTKGVDGSIGRGNKADVCVSHLDHEPFEFKIIVDRKSCATSKSGKATVRIMMAPRYNEHGERLSLQEQRRLIFSLDAFPVELRVGRNTIRRKDIDSSLTRPWTPSLYQLERGRPNSAAADYCACGWPQHLYIPKGDHKGLDFDIFVMVTNFDDDFVPNNPKDLKYPEPCNSPYIFCGLPRRRYPDAKPMGYPFDRPIYKAHTLEEFVSPVSNMGMTTVGIRHIGKPHLGHKR